MWEGINGQIGGDSQVGGNNDIGGSSIYGEGINGMIGGDSTVAKNNGFFRSNFDYDTVNTTQRSRDRVAYNTKNTERAKEREYKYYSIKNNEMQGLWGNASINNGHSNMVGNYIKVQIKSFLGL